MLSLFFLNSACNPTAEHSVADENPVMMFRLSIDNTVSDEAWENTLSAFKSYPRCCDEVWFSTGIGMPQMDVHRQHAMRLVRGT